MILRFLSKFLTVKQTINPNIFSREGVAGKNKVPTQVIVEKPRDLYPLNGGPIQTPPPSGKQDIIFSIMSRDGRHITSYPISQARLERTEAEGFWVLRDQDIY